MSESEPSSSSGPKKRRTSEKEPNEKFDAESVSSSAASALESSTTGSTIASTSDAFTIAPTSTASALASPPTNTNAVAVPQNHQDQADILRIMDIDCFEETFDFLTIQDIISIGKTCKRLNQVAGYIIQQIYSGDSAHCKGGKITIRNNIKIDDFTGFVPKIRIESDENFQHFLNIHGKFHRLREIELNKCGINEAKTECLTKIFNKIGAVYLDFCKIQGNLHEIVLQKCPNLKRLRITIPKESQMTQFLYEVENNWLHHQYPNLEYFGLLFPGADESYQFPGVKIFLEKNSSIQTFATLPNHLWAQRESMLTSKVKLFNLAIFVGGDEKVDLDSFVNLLNQLHSNGFYERLHLFCPKTDIVQNSFCRLNSPMALNITSRERDANISVFKHIEELYFPGCYDNNGLRQMNLSTLNQVHFHRAFIPHIELLVAQAPNLRRIICRNIQYRIFEREYIENYIIRVGKFNLQRRKLLGAKKVTIFVPEKIYLRTKWFHDRTDLRFVKVMRYETFQQVDILKCLETLDNDFNF